MGNGLVKALYDVSLNKFALRVTLKFCITIFQCKNAAKMGIWCIYFESTVY